MGRYIITVNFCFKILKPLFKNLVYFRVHNTVVHRYGSLAGACLNLFCSTFKAKTKKQLCTSFFPIGFAFSSARFGSQSRYFKTSSRLQNLELEAQNCSYELVFTRALQGCKHRASVCVVRVKTVYCNYVPTVIMYRPTLPVGPFHPSEQPE